MSEVSWEEIERMMDMLYEHGGNPEYVIGRCPHCGEPFEYELGTLKQGHFASKCQKAPPVWTPRYLSVALRTFQPKRLAAALGRRRVER